MTLRLAILAGGLATRIRPLTEKFPKALIEINGEPFISHQLKLLRGAGITEVVICAWYREDLIRDFVGDGSAFDMAVKISSDGEIPLGTGGAIKKALPLLGDSFFVLYGDSYLPCDYRAIETAFINSQKNGLMTVYKNSDLGDLSNVEFSQGQIKVYDKKNRTPQMAYIDYGLGLFKAGVFDQYPAVKAFDLAGVYQDLLADGQLAGFEVPERFYEIGSFQGIEDLSEYLRKKK